MADVRQLARPLIPYAEALIGIAREAGIDVRVTSTRRGRGEQARLYQRFISGQSRYPAAPPGTSKHELGLAFDISANPTSLRQLGELWESWGGRWGGRFSNPDPIHFEV